MEQRTVSEMMVEGRRLTMEHAALLKTSITGTLTTEEQVRKSQLEGYLLGLMEQVMAKENDTANEWDEEEEGYEEDEDEEEEDEGTGYTSRERYIY